jgi:hypothetical protein
MRVNLAATKSKVTGWEKRQTSRPRSLMITTKFLGVLIIVSSSGRRLARPLDDIQLQYLKLLELTPDCLVTPYPQKKASRDVNEKYTEMHSNLCGISVLRQNCVTQSGSLFPFCSQFLGSRGTMRD